MLIFKKHNVPSVAEVLKDGSSWHKSFSHLLHADILTLVDRREGQW